MKTAYTIKYINILLGFFVLFGLYLTTLYSYLLFHSLSEIFSIVVACGIFMVAWNSRHFLDNNYLLFLGIAYLFIGGTDLVHTLSYRGMNIFQGYGPNGSMGLNMKIWMMRLYITPSESSLTPWAAPWAVIARKTVKFRWLL